MKKNLILVLVLTGSLKLLGQTYSTLTLTDYMDQFRFEASGENRYWFMSKTQTDNKAFALYSPEDGGWFTYWKEGSGDMILNKGKIGIGISSPEASLAFSNTIGNKIDFYHTPDFDGDRYGISINSSELRIHSGALGQASGGIIFGKHSTTTFTEHVRFTNNGNVGIGTDNPDSKLVVNGKIRSEEVKVEIINGPDYVFKPDYQLRTLQETKEYITENNHLPEIPSAKEMEANGIDLGDMNMRLLKKIEELTLYQIELLEKVEELQAKVEKLEN